MHSLTALALTLSVSGMIGSVSPARAGSVSDDADATIENAVVDHRIPAISAAISVDGEILWTGAAGFANLENNTPATTETSFRIASISKVLTATAILQLAERGFVDLQASVHPRLYVARQHDLAV